MKRRTIARATLVLLAASAPVDARERVRLSIACSAEGALKEFRVGEGSSITVKGDIDLALHLAVPNRNTEIVIANGVDTPYRCIGAFVFSLQRAGYRRVAFISEPPAER